jgi:cellulose synthase operon protein C
MTSRKHQVAHHRPGAISVKSSVTAWTALAFCIALLGACGRDSESLVKSAQEYLAKGDANSAVIQLRNVLQKSPDNAEARYLLGTTLLDRRDPAGAVKELRRALELGYPKDKTVPPLARALIEDGDAKELVTEFGNVKLDSTDAQAALKASVGEAQLSLGKVNEAEEAFTAATQIKPNFPKALLGLATLRAGKGDIPGAVKIVDDVLARSPVPVEAYLMKARLLLADNQPDEALAVLQKAVENRPDYLPARYELASMLIAKGDYDPATAQIDAIRKVSKLDSRAYYFEALIAARRGNLAAARESIQQVLKASPEHVPSLLLAGEIELRSKQYDSAQSYLRKALQGAPNSTYVQRLLAVTYLRLGSPARAVEVLQQPLSRGSKDPQLMAVAGEAYLAVGDFPKAEQYFAQTVALQPTNAQIRTRLGQVRLAQGETDSAIRDLEAASQLDPNVSQADLALIANMIRQKQFDQALAAVLKLEKKQPNNPLVYNLKGIIYLSKGDTDGGRANFERALQIQSDYLPAVSNLAQLERLQKKPELARTHYDKVLAKEPNNEQALMGLANLLQVIGSDSNEVESLLKKAVTANPQAINARGALARFYLRKGDARQALLVAQEANAALPNDPLTLELLGQVQLATGDATQATATFTKLVAARPGVIEPLMRLAQALIAAKEPDKAVERLREILTINPEYFEADREIVAIYAQTGRVEQALSQAKSLQGRKPSDSRGYMLEGNVWSTQGKWHEAEVAYSAAQKRAPDDGAVAARLHAVVSEEGKEAQADAVADKWLHAHPKDVVFRAYLGERALKKPDYKAAAKHYQALIALQPENIIFLNNLAWVSGEMGDARALSYAEKASTIAPSSPAVLDTLGMLQLKKGDVNPGLENLRKAATLAPTQADIRLHFAKALIQSGNKEAARKELDALAQAGTPPDNAVGAARDGAGKAPQPGAINAPKLTCTGACAAEVAALLKAL